jgi:hypothetical protein
VLWNSYRSTYEGTLSPVLTKACTQAIHNFNLPLRYPPCKNPQLSLAAQSIKQREQSTLVHTPHNAHNFQNPKPRASLCTNDCEAAIFGGLSAPTNSGRTLPPTEGGEYQIQATGITPTRRKFRLRLWKLPSVSISESVSLPPRFHSACSWLPDSTLNLPPVTSSDRSRDRSKLKIALSAQSRIRCKTVSSCSRSIKQRIV